MGSNSAPTIIVPSFGVSGYGSPTSNLTPTITSVSPILTIAEPSAVFTTPSSTLIGCLSSVSFLPSNLVFASSKLMIWLLSSLYILHLHSFVFVFQSFFLDFVNVHQNFFAHSYQLHQFLFCYFAVHLQQADFA